MIDPRIVFAATFMASDRAAKWPDPRDFAIASRAPIEMLALHFSSLERQRMPRALPSDSQFHTSCLPLDAVWLNAPPAAAPVSDQVRHFMLQGAPDLGFGNISQFGIQLNLAVRPPSTTRCRTHARIPDHAHFSLKLRQLHGMRLLTAPGCQFNILQSVFWSNPPSRGSLI